MIDDLQGSGHESVGEDEVGVGVARRENEEGGAWRMEVAAVLLRDGVVLRSRSRNRGVEEWSGEEEEQDEERRRGRAETPTEREEHQRAEGFKERAEVSGRGLEFGSWLALARTCLYACVEVRAKVERSESTCEGGGHS